MKAYIECTKKKKRTDSDITTLPHKKRGRHCLLGECIDKQLQLYLKKICDHGGVITASVVVAAARGIIISEDRSKLAEFGVC